MAYITWTDTLVNGDNVTQTHITNLKSDITAQVNGNITNANISASAAITESKITFNSATGHNHDGTSSKVLASAKHYRNGLQLKQGTTADDHIKIEPGYIEVGGTGLSSTADSSDIDINTPGNWVNGSASASTWCYVYAYSSSGTLTLKLSNQAPDLSYSDDTTAEYPLRYQAYSSVYYRCLGCVFIDAAGDLCWGQASSEGLYVSQFDGSNVCIIGGLGTAADQTFNTIWTPKKVNVIYGTQDTTPADDESVTLFSITQQMLDTNWYAVQLNYNVYWDNSFQTGPISRWQAITTVGSINAVTTQAAGTAGSFTIDAMADNQYFYAIAYTDKV